MKTTTGSQQAKPSSRRKRLTKSVEHIKQNWWPFDRVDGKILEALHKQHVQRAAEPAPF